MSIETAQKLKAQLTDKYVVIKPGIAELQRFASLTGVVKTVNMSGRALVEFNGPADIGWYDIDPQYLTVVDAPVKKAAVPEKHAAAKAAPDKKSAAPAAGTPAGKSPLEMARAQGASATVGTKPAAAVTESTAAAATKKLSPLEMARQQGALKAGAAAAPKPAAPAAKPESAAPVASAPAAKKMSPLEIARMQGAAGGECLSTPPAAATAPIAAAQPIAAAPPVAAPAASPPEVKPTVKASAPPSGKKLSPLELARQQGAFKTDKD